MPKSYVSKSHGYIFNLIEESNGVYYYRIIHRDGRYLSYKHAFSSIDEMEAYSG